MNINELSVEQAVLLAFAAAAVAGMWAAWMGTKGDEWKITVLVRGVWGRIGVLLQFHRIPRHMPFTKRGRKIPPVITKPKEEDHNHE